MEARNLRFGGDRFLRLRAPKMILSLGLLVGRWHAQRRQREKDTSSSCDTMQDSGASNAVATTVSQSSVSG